MLTIAGLQRLQRVNEQMIMALQPKGAMGEALRYATTEAHRRAIYNTPWDTGGGRASHRMRIAGLRGEIFIDPTVTNPRQGGKRPAEYLAYLHKQGMRPGLRGGIRAFYQYTVEVDGPKIVKVAGAILRGGLPR